MNKKYTFTFEYEGDEYTAETDWDEEYPEYRAEDAAMHLHDSFAWESREFNPTIIIDGRMFYVERGYEVTFSADETCPECHGTKYSPHCPKCKNYCCRCEPNWHENPTYGGCTNPFHKELLRA